MSKQERDFPRRERFGSRLDFMLRRRPLVGIVAILMGASLVFSGNVSAHNIDVAKVRELARDYARQVRAESNGKYIHYSTKCVRSNPGHNHYVGCVIEYQNEKDTQAGVYTCKESLVFFMSPHSNSVQSFEIFMKHDSYNYCGKRRITGERVS